MPDLENSFSWSKSRDDIFRSCRRRYFFNYYGSWGGWDPSVDRRTRQIYILKNISSRHIWIGSIVHEFVQQLLDKIRYGYEVDLYSLLGNLRRTMRQDFERSENGNYTRYPKIDGRTYGLFEHEYNVFIPNREWGQIFERAEMCLTNFFNSDTFRYIKSIGTENWLQMERLQTFDFEGTPVYVKIDFALENNGDIFIFDWKTGKVRDVEMDIQLACYGLYAQEKWGVPAQKIFCKRYNLYLDIVDNCEINDNVLQEAESYMRKSISSMKELLYDKDKNIAIEDDFEMCSDEKICRDCNFKKVCPGWGLIQGSL